MNKTYKKPTGFCSKPFSPLKKLVLNRLAQGREYYFYGVKVSMAVKGPETRINGGRMKIKFEKAVQAETNPNANGKKFKIIRVHGTALEGKLADQEWTTQFFANNKDLKGQTDKLNKGDIVNVKMKKNGNFWNPESFTKESGTTPVNGTVASSSPPVVTAASTEEMDRRMNMEIAVEILGQKPTKKDAFEYLQQAAAIADLIQAYCEKKGAFQFSEETTDGIPEELPDKGEDIDTANLG